jgi:hypothetical protein
VRRSSKRTVAAPDRSPTVLVQRRELAGTPVRALASDLSPTPVTGVAQADQAPSPAAAAGVDLVPSAPDAPAPAANGAGAGAASSVFFFFAGMALLAGLLLLRAPGVLRRLQTAAAVWRPVHFVSLLERPG